MFMKRMMKVVSISVFLAMFVGCALTPPMFIKRPVPPDFVYGEIPETPMLPDQTLTPIEEFVNTSTIINKYVKKAVKTGRKIGVMDFTTPERLKGSGNLVADTLSIHLFKNGLQVIERQNISKILDEQNMRAESRQDLSAEEVAKKIGKITGSDYIVFGAVTQFHFENATLPIPYKIHDDLLKSYIDNVTKYEKQLKKYKSSQNKMDKKYYKYLEKDFLSQMSINDLNRGLHYKINNSEKSFFFPTRGYNWKGYKSAQNINWDYPYITNKPVLPLVGVSRRWVENRRKIIEHEIEAWKLTFNNFLKTYDRQISQQEYEKSLPLSGLEMRNSYEKYIETGKENEYIKKVKAFCKEVTDRLKKYDSLLYQLRACRLDPIPKVESQFEFPNPSTRFVSVANLGFTLKIVDINTGDIIWIGQTSKRDISVQKGLNTMASSVVKDIISGKL
ncbi:Curli production assembly/transport component CsgG [Candidatus Magnetomorum sp. HK-1]|nr:Curli production assembly/transport component CsgG [Candidatus Magnetomorum sp. HK-1]